MQSKASKRIAVYCKDSQNIAMYFEKKNFAMFGKMSQGIVNCQKRSQNV